MKKLKAIILAGVFLLATALFAYNEPAIANGRIAEPILEQVAEGNRAY